MPRRRRVRWNEYKLECDKCPDRTFPSSQFGLTLAKMHMGQMESRGEEHIVMVIHNTEGPICCAKYF